MTAQLFTNIVPRSFRDNLAQQVASGFYEYPQYYQQVAYIHSPRTIATLINDHITQKIIENLCGEDLKYRSVTQRKIFVFQDAVVLHFKKIDENLMSSNYPTPTAVNFNSQTEIKDIPAKLPRIQIGYMVDQAGATLRGIYAIERQGARVLWALNMEEADDNAQQDLKYA